MNRVYLLMLAPLALAIPGAAQQQMTRQAQINGNAVDGKCTIEIDVDGSAEVEIRGNTGTIRNLSGQRAAWRRFVCNGQMPQNPGDFRFRGIDGRGNVQLLRDPRQARVAGKVIPSILSGAVRAVASGTARTTGAGGDLIFRSALV